jgi:hypothetical protein
MTSFVSIQAESTTVSTVRRLPLLAFGLSLSAFLAISVVLCIVGYFIAPDLPVRHDALSVLLPGFKMLSWQAFLLGLAESYAWGWYIALIFVPLYNFCAAHWR